MQQTSISGVPSPAAAAPGRFALAALAAGALIAISIPLAAPGVELIPGAGSVDSPGPRWVLGAFGDGFGTGPGLYLGLLYAATAVWAVLLCCARDLGLRPVAAVAGLLIAIFTVAGPLLSLDVFSYIAYARLGVEHGLDPYEFGPAAIPSTRPPPGSTTIATRSPSTGRCSRSAAIRSARSACPRRSGR